MKQSGVASSIIAVLLLCVVRYSAHAKPAARKPKPPVPYLHIAWKEELTETADRMAAADTVGDGKIRLILLASKPQQTGVSTLIVKVWNGTAFTTEFTGEAQAPADRLAVGHFAGADKPAVIVTADAVWSWNGKTYDRKASRKLLDLFGSARLKNGDERIILSESVTQFKSYKVNPGVDDWLVDRADAPSASTVECETMHATPEFFRKMGMPSFLCAGGLITIWDITRAEVPYLFYVRPVRALEDGAPVGKSNSFVGFRDGTEIGGNELWTSPRLAGLATDLSTSDPRNGGKRGLLLLSSGSETNRSRTVYYFTID